METRKTTRAAKSQEPLIVLRCPACGLFIAAGRDPKLIELAQKYHVCPESLFLASHNQQLTKE
jgi:ribosomal protein S27AE